MLIGLCGRPQSGKSEVARILIDHHNFTLIDVKDKLRSICAEVTGLPYYYFTNHKDMVYRGQTLRAIMGEIGLTTERLFGESYLLDISLHGLDNNKNYVIDSLRQNQSDYFNGEIIEVKSPNSISTGYSFDEYKKDKINYTLYNNGDLKDLSDSIVHLLKKIKNHAE